MIARIPANYFPALIAAAFLLANGVAIVITGPSAFYGMHL